MAQEQTPQQALDALETFAHAEASSWGGRKYARELAANVRAALGNSDPDLASRERRACQEARERQSQAPLATS